MNKAIIKILYRQVIEVDSEENFEKAVWQASYDEFLLKSQAYNREGKHATFQQMVANDGRANSLHYKSGFAVAGYIETLRKQIPQLTDSIDRSIAFDTYEFKLIDSDITNSQAHKVAIHYITGPLTYLGTIGNYLVLSADNIADAGAPAETFMLAVQPNLSIVSYQLLQAFSENKTATMMS